MAGVDTLVKLGVKYGPKAIAAAKRAMKTVGSSKAAAKTVTKVTKSAAKKGGRLKPAIGKTLKAADAIGTAATAAEIAKKYKWPTTGPKKTGPSPKKIRADRTEENTRQALKTLAVGGAGSKSPNERPDPTKRAAALNGKAAPIEVKKEAKKTVKAAKKAVKTATKTVKKAASLKAGTPLGMKNTYTTSGTHAGGRKSSASRKIKRATSLRASDYAR